MCTNGTQVPCKVPSLPNPTTCKGWPHHRGLRPPLFSNRGVGSFYAPQEQISESAVRPDLRFFRPYPRRLESLTICRWKERPWVLVRPGFELTTSRSTDRRSPNWANQAAVCIIIHLTWLHFPRIVGGDSETGTNFFFRQLCGTSDELVC